MNNSFAVKILQRQQDCLNEVTSLLLRKMPLCNDTVEKLTAGNTEKDKLFFAVSSEIAEHFLQLHDKIKLVFALVNFFEAHNVRVLDALHDRHLTKRIITESVLLILQTKTKNASV